LRTGSLHERILSRHKLAGQGLTTHLHTLTSPVRSFSHYHTLLPSALDRCPFTAFSPSAFCCSCNNYSPPRETALLELLDARPCSPNPYHLQNRTSVEQHYQHRSCQSLAEHPVLQHRFENIVSSCAHCLDRSVSAYLFPASYQASRGPELHPPASPRATPSRFIIHFSPLPRHGIHD
jgi:hypothetical protein